MDYACGARAKALFSISPSWAELPGCLSVSYEKLVEDTAGQLSALCNAICPAPAEAIRYAVDANTMEKQRGLVSNQHFWQGRPGHWKRFLTSREASRIAEAQRRYCEAFGYAADADSELTDQEADANWYSQEFASLREECRIARSQTLKALDDLRKLGPLSEAVHELKVEAETSLGHRLRHLPAVQKLRRGAGRLIRGIRGTAKNCEEEGPVSDL